VAKDRPAFGNPAAFNSSIPESYWQSFTVTLRDPAFFDKMEAFSATSRDRWPGHVKDSRWLMSIVLAYQPHFADQPAGVFVFWGYALHRIASEIMSPSRCRNVAARTSCASFAVTNFDFTRYSPPPTAFHAGALHHSMFMPRAKTDRPSRCRQTPRNLAFVSQFVEIPRTWFSPSNTRCGRANAVYELLDIKREIPPILHHDKSLKVNLDAVFKAFE